MGERSSYAPGTFCWAGLGTGDAAAATEFYTGLFGWEAVAGGDVTTFRLAGGDVCELQHQGGPGWLSYVSVDDVDAVTTRAQAAGATVVTEPVEVRAEARIAVLEDPTGARFALWEPRARIGATLVNDPGAMCLNQLNTTEPDAAAAFYTEAFGWTIEQMGGGDQLYWGIYNGPGVNGGMMRLPEGAEAPPHWFVYFATADIDASANRVGELGGQVLVPPNPVPGGRIAVALDATGSTFGLLTGRLDP